MKIAQIFHETCYVRCEILFGKIIISKMETGGGGQGRNEKYINSQLAPR